METFIQNFNNAIGWSIVHSLWQGACFYLILFGLFMTFPKMKPSAKYVVSFLTQSALFISFIYTYYLYISYEPINSSISKLNEEQELILYINYLKTKSWSITNLFPYLVTVYTIGICTQIILSIKSFEKLQWLRKKGTVLVPLTWQESFNNMLYKHKNTADISLQVSNAITIPITIGFLKPIIIIPTAYINNITQEEAEAILLHEFAHIKRHDYLFNIVLIIIETLMFFNPFVWLISKHIKMERELACDDFASEQTVSPTSYAKALLKVELLKKENSSIFAMAASGSKNHNLFDRIKRINDKNMETKHTSIRHQLSAILLASVALLSIAWINPSQSKNDKTNDKNIIDTNSTTIARILSTNQDTIISSKSRKNIINQQITTTTSKEISEHQDINDLTIKLENEGKALQAYFESPEWKNQLSEIEKSSADIQKQFNSPEWKERISAIEINAKNIEEYFNSPAWKDKIAFIESNAKKAEDIYNSSEYKEKIALIEENARKIESMYNSPEYKDKIARIEENARKIEAMYNSPEYKERIAKIEENAKKIESMYDSKEYKAIQQKYQQDLQNLKKEKGIK